MESTAHSTVTPFAGVGSSPQPATPPIVAVVKETPFDPMRFAEAHRIHIVDASLPTDIQLLHLHVSELDPKNEAALRRKLHVAFKQDTPCFGTTPGLNSLATILMNAAPLSVEAEGAQLSKLMESFLKKKASGVDPLITDAQKADTAPFQAAIDKKRKREPLEPALADRMKHGVGMALLVEKAIGNKFVPNFESFLQSNTNPQMGADRLFAILERYGIDGVHLQQAAQKGMQAFGDALHVDPLYIDEVNRLTEALAKANFSDNALQNWQIGRQQLGMAHAGISEQMKAGIAPRVTQKIIQLRNLVQGHYDVSPEIAAIEKQVAGEMRLLPPPLSEALFRNGTSIVFAPKSSLPAPPGMALLGEHGHQSLHGDDVSGLCCINVSKGQGADDAARVLVHEAHHLQFPNQLAKADIDKAEALVKSDAQRLATLVSTLDVWSAGNDEQKATAIKQIETQFTGGKPLAEMLGGKSIETLAIMAHEAADRLDPQSGYFRSGPYSEVATRFEEVNSRYAELRYVRMREEPELLKFLVPGITEAYDTVYLPHIERQVKEFRARDEQAEKAAHHVSAHQNHAVPETKVASIAAHIPPAAAAVAVMGMAPAPAR